jgi:hypothetical protein
MVTLLVIVGCIWLLIATIFVLSLAAAARCESSEVTAKDPAESPHLVLEQTEISASMPGPSPDSSSGSPAPLPPLKLPAPA